MKCRKKALHVCAWLCICLIVGWIVATLVAKPIPLTREEVLYYTNIAEKLWYEGGSSIEKDNSIIIKFTHNEEKVQISPYNGNKQSLTADFSQSESAIVTINEPIISFWACFVVYGVIVGTIVYGIIWGCVWLGKEFHNKK